MRLSLDTTLTQETLTFSYLPACLKKNKSGWVIEYWVENPALHTMSRKRIRVDHIRKRYTRQSEAVAHILKIANEINIKLMKGWNPFILPEDARLYTDFKTVIKKYIDEKQRELRPDTIRSYKSFLSAFFTFTQKCLTVKYAGQFTKLHASQYMDYLSDNPRLGLRSQNNQLKFMRVFFNWMLEKCYVNNNPFMLIKGKKKQEKKRIIIDPGTRHRIEQHLQKENPVLLVFFQLIYSSLIRPKELINIKVGDVDFEHNTIRIDSSVAKNHHQRFAAITPQVKKNLEYIRSYKPDMWLFSQQFTPSYTQAHRAKFGKLWIKLRDELRLPAEMQLYSLRDTGIYDMLKAGIDPLTVKQHADHHSLEMTTIYSNHSDPNLTNIIFTQAPEF
jgi:site-specific recombinase XerD